ncbi:MAG: general secretion pathway protein GspK [Methylobacteriaceae bacterium]|nr:general secretion pathway protein GspK [Methylobacteriaceae bacterium]
MSRGSDIADAPRDAGTVIIAVLWLLGLLSFVTAAMAVYTTNTLSAVDVYGDRARADAVIAGGVELAVWQLLTTEKPLQGSSSGTIGDARVAFDYRDETARIDVNAAAPELLAGLFTSLGARDNEADAYAQRIVEVREPSQAEAAQAAQAGAGPPRKRFVDVAQLDQVQGLPEALIARAKPFLTVYSARAEINPRICAPEILAALPGMTRERVRTALALRARNSSDHDAWADALGEAAKFTTDDPGRSARLRVKADLRDGFTATSEIVIVRFDDDAEPYRVLAWEDDVDLYSPAGATKR